MEQPASNPASTSVSLIGSRKRRRYFRLAAILCGVAALVAVELLLRLAGVDRYVAPAAPLVGFSDIQPLFELDAAGDRFVIPETRRAFFQPDSFAANKSVDEFRVFCLGGSTVQGRPYSIETSFTTWLELNLRAAEPQRSWEVVNCGGVSYASYRLVPILQEVIQYQPDFVVVYTGHNEFLEQRSYASLRRQPRWFRAFSDRVLQLRIASLLRTCLPAPKPTNDKVDLPAEVDALLDYQGGLAKYHRDERWRSGVVYEYEQNLRRMIEIADEAGVPLVFVNPVSNVRDTPPFKVELPGNWTDLEKTEFEEAWASAKGTSWDDLSEKQAVVENVLELDVGHAEAWFLLAKVFDAQGDYEAARSAYLKAKDADVCPLRMLETMHADLQRVAQDTNTDLLDARSMFEREDKVGVPGDDQLIDHVHPRIEGHQAIGQLVFDYMLEKQWVANSAGWEQRRQELYRANYASLPPNYFPESVERLRGLKLWAAGRVTRLKLSDGHGNSKTRE